MVSSIGILFHLLIKPFALKRNIETIIFMTKVIINIPQINECIGLMVCHIY